ncbi:hypothetical protein RclHR1_00270014 [Rhizophagus clarus]|uniref:Uncharacterized protein n=1 Tax=Rhizophagus clarus TaxID=94130 RepID=A0A2Z6RW44_9GLOM|nr:hypothetical protein RclHR1_00270014 [Rhizophagus clarus]
MINEDASNCYEPVLYFRLIYPNGTVNFLDIPAKQIPRFNFCKVLDDIVYQLNIKIWPLEPNYIYVTYLNSSDIDASVHGLLINWSGNILSNSFIDKAAVNLNGTVSPPGSLYYENNGFLYVGKLNKTDISWSYYSLSTTKNSVQLLRRGVIKGGEASYVQFFGFTQFTNGFYLIVAKSFNHPNVFALDLANVNLLIETYFINANETKDPTPNIIYQSPIPNLNVITMSCGMNYKGGGISCLLYLALRDTLDNLYGLRIRFRTNGAIAVVREVPTLSILGNPELNLKSIAAGGILLTANFNLRDKRSIYGYILNSTGYILNEWPLPQPISITARGHAFDILPNNTFVAATKYAGDNFTIITSGFPKIPIKGDVGYFNPLIISSYPPLEGLIPLRATKINITYSEPINISSRNISIYQYFDPSTYLLRQTYPASAGFTKLSNDSQTLIVDVFDSTFNKPYSIYHIIVEPDAVRIMNTGDPAFGIQDNVWNVTTGNETIIGSNEPIIGFVRLSPEGTEKFNSLDEKGKGNFTNSLGRELALIVPVEENRIIPLYLYQKDQKTKEKRMLLAFKIGSVNNDTNITAIAASPESPENIMNDLNALIGYGGLTLVSNLDHTSNLDTSYGFVRKRDIFRDNRVQLILFVIILFLLISLIFCLKRQAKTGAVLKFILALVAFVFYTIYNFENAQDVETLALASVLLLVLPFVIKLSLGLFIIIQESKKNPTFHEWVNNHMMMAYFFIFLSGVDLDSITVLSSEMEDTLRAPLTRSAHQRIDVIEFIGLILKDIPILVVLILYYELALDYGIVPFFALVSVMILIIWVLLRYLVWCFKKCKNDDWWKRLSSKSKRDISGDSSENLTQGISGSSGSSLWNIFSPKSKTDVSGDSSEDLTRDIHGSSGSSWWKKLLPRTIVGGAASGAASGRTRGSLCNKLGLGRLFSKKRSRHLFDESGNVIGDVTVTGTQAKEIITTRILKDEGDTTTTIITESLPGGASSQSGEVKKVSGSTIITEDPTRQVTILTEEIEQGEGGGEPIEQIEYVVQEVEEVEEKDDDDKTK